MRTSSLLALLLVSGCGQEPADRAVLANVEAEQGAAADEDGRIECAVSPDAALRRDCDLERTETDAGTVLTVRQPEGGFHRLLVTRDGRGVVAADGAEPARVAIVAADRIEVSIGQARYRLPATVGPITR